MRTWTLPSASGGCLATITVRDGGDEFLAQIFRHALDVRQPRRAQPGGKTVRAVVSRVLGRKLERVDFETEFRQPFFVIRRRVKKIRLRHLAEKFAPAFQPHFRAQREKNILRVALAAAGNNQPSARVSDPPPRRAEMPDDRPPNAARRWKKRGRTAAPNLNFPRVHDVKFQIRKFAVAEKSFARTRSFPPRRPRR